MVEKNKSQSIEFQHRDGYIEVKFLKPTVIDIELARYMITERKAFSNYQPTTVLIDGRNVKGVTKEARDHLGQDTGFELIIAAAILTGSPLSALILNFFVKVNIRKSKKVPVRLFTDREKAVKWLKKQ